MGCNNSKKKDNHVEKPTGKKKKKKKDYSDDDDESSSGSDDEEVEVENVAPRNEGIDTGKHRKKHNLWGGAVRKLAFAKAIAKIEVREEVKQDYNNDTARVEQIQANFLAAANEYGDKDSIHLNHIGLLKSLKISHHDCYENKTESQIEVRGLFASRMLDHFDQYSHLDESSIENKSKYEKYQIGFNAFAHGIGHLTHKEEEKQSEAIFKIYGGKDAWEKKKIKKSEFVRMTASMMASASATDELGSDMRRHGIDSNDIDETMKNDYVLTEILSEIFDETFPDIKDEIDFQTFHQWLHKIKHFEAIVDYSDVEEEEEVIPEDKTEESEKDEDSGEVEASGVDEMEEDNNNNEGKKKTTIEVPKLKNDSEKPQNEETLEQVMKRLQEADEIATHTHHISDKAKATVDEATVDSNKEKQVDDLLPEDDTTTFNNNDDVNDNLGNQFQILPPPDADDDTTQPELQREKTLEEVMKSLQEADEISAHTHHISDEAKITV